MDLPKIKQLKPSYNSLRIIGRVMYEAGAPVFWLHLSENTGASCANGANFIETFWGFRNEALKYLKTVDKFTVNLVNLNGTKVPFLYNSLQKLKK